jgi:hypothetical protein
VAGDRVTARLLVAGLAATAVLRLLLNAILPLSDTTEARYAEIVRVGLENGYWLMPHAARGEPFFAKPPGSTWLAMLSGSLLSPSEAALRLPSLLLMAAVALIVASVIRRRPGGSQDAALVGAAIVVTAPIGFVLAGAVMTDAAQLLAVTSAMACRSRCTGSSPATAHACCVTTCPPDRSWSRRPSRCPGTSQQRAPIPASCGTSWSASICSATSSRVGRATATARPVASRSA